MNEGKDFPLKGNKLRKQAFSWKKNFFSYLCDGLLSFQRVWVGQEAVEPFLTPLISLSLFCLLVNFMVSQSG